MGLHSGLRGTLVSARRRSSSIVYFLFHLSREAERHCSREGLCSPPFVKFSICKMVWHTFV